MIYFTGRQRNKSGTSRGGHSRINARGVASSTLTEETLLKQVAAMN
ncbi:hypothetical protein [Rivularia sp. PCC 7116]|nr:hypothetical protein [Rivularia sp. PCC 7116]